MAATAQLVAKVAVDSDGQHYDIGTDDLPVTLTLTSPSGGGLDRFVIAAGATATLWDSTVGPSTFGLLVLTPSATGALVELQGNTVADNHHFTLKAGIPFILPSNATLRYNAASFTGAADTFKKCLVKNTSGVTITVTRFIHQ